MTINATDKTWNFTDVSASGDYESNNRDGDKYFTFDMPDIGGAPTVALYARLTDGNELEYATLDSAQIGTFTGGNHLGGLLPVYQTLDGSTGTVMVNPYANGASMSAQVGLSITLDPFTEFTTSFQMGVPVGYNFSGAAEPYVMPDVSAIKLCWVSDGIYNAGATQANNVVYSWAGASWAIVGNLAPPPIYMGSKFTFDKWNSFLCHQKAGANPSVDNGVTEAIMRTPDDGYTSVLKTDDVIFHANAANKHYTTLEALALISNGTQTNTQHVLRNWYIATGDNSRARVEIGDNAVYEDCGEAIIIPQSVWDNGVYTSIAVPSKQRQGMTHWHLTRADGTRESGEITWL